MEMQQRIDALIQMRREKPEHTYHWERLQLALINEQNLLSHEQAEHLMEEFNAIRQHELLERWDSQFHEVVITGTITDPFESQYAAQGKINGGLTPASSLSLGKTSISESELAMIKKVVNARSATAIGTSMVNEMIGGAYADASAKQRAY